MNSPSPSPCVTCRPAPAKWNKIEHRLFSFITQNWRAKPLVSYRVIVDLIASTTTETGLKVLCELDSNTYPKGIAVSDAEMESLNIQRHAFHRNALHIGVPIVEFRRALPTQCIEAHFKLVTPLSRSGRDASTRRAYQ